MDSVKEKIRAKIKSRKKGEIIMPSDYELEFGVENTKKHYYVLTMKDL